MVMRDQRNQLFVGFLAGFSVSLVAFTVLYMLIDTLGRLMKL